MTQTLSPSQPPAPQGSDPWMPNGFPPPSFVVDTERTRSFAGARGRWLAAAAILGVLLLIAGLVLIANEDDKPTKVAAGPSTTAFGDTVPTSSTSVLDPTATLPNAGTSIPGTPVDPSATTTPGGGGSPGTTAAPGPGATSAPPAPGAPALAVSPGTIAIPKVDSTVGPQSGKVALKNNGASTLNYNSQTNFSGLTVNPATGSVGAGAGLDVTLTLNGASAAEGPFTGLVSFGGNGGSQQVTVTSSIGRPPIINDNADAARLCPTEGTTCSKQTRSVSATGNPCTGEWFFVVNVSDESQLKAVRADMATDVELRINNQPNGPGGVWQSANQPKLPAGAFTFTIEAVDQFDNVRRSTPRTINCPPA